MNNEPVAYINKDDGLVCAECFNPLYTHPVKEQDCYGDGNVYRGVRSKDSEVQTIYFNPVKEQLTDEEILEIASPMFEDTRYPSTALDFARAIEKRIKTDE